MKNFQLRHYCVAIIAVATLLPIIASAQSKTEFIHPNTLPCNSVISLVTGSDGQVWGQGVKYAPNNRTEVVSIMRFDSFTAERINTPERGYPISDSIRINQLLPDARRGVLWATTIGGLLRFDGERWEIINYSDSLTSRDNVKMVHIYKNLAIDSTGALLVGDELQEIDKIYEGGSYSYNKAYYRLLRYDGNSWQVLLDGIYSYSGKMIIRKFTKIGSITVMQDGTIWVYYSQMPTTKGGLARLRNGNVEIFDNVWCWQNEHPNIKGGGTLSAGKDFLWVRNSDDGGTEGILGGVSKFYPEENRWRHFTNADGFPMRGDSSLRTSCFYDNGNEIWMDDDINGGAFVYDGTKTKYFRTRQPDVQNEPLITYTRRVNTITEDAFGRVWCGTGYGIVVFTDALSGTDESMQVQGIEVFPNPASDFFTVHCPEGATITVRDVFGRIKTINDKVVDGKATISTEGFASGIYFVEIHDLNGRRNVSKVAINR